MPPPDFYSIRKFLIPVSIDVLNYFCHIPFLQVLLFFLNLLLLISFYFFSKLRLMHYFLTYLIQFF